MLTFQQSYLIAIAGVVLACAVAWWTYRRTTPPLVPPRRWTLTALRALALALLGFLLAGPLLRRIAGDRRPATVAVVVDDSESMRLHDPARALPGRIDAFAGDFLGEARVARFRFGADAEPAERFAGMRYTATRTDLGRALARPAERLAAQNLQGIVLVTDGRATAGRNALYVAERLGVPVFPVVVGDTLPRRDVAVTALLANRRVPPGAAQPVEVRVRSSGYGGASAVVTLSAGGRTVATRAVALPDGRGEVSVSFDYTPPAPGALTLTATAARLPGEATAENNARSLTVQVVQERTRVLLLAGAPDPDVGALRAALEADALVDLTVRVQKAPGEFYEGPLPAELGAFGAAFLVGYPGRGADPAVLERLAAAPRLGIVVVAGSQTDWNLLARALGSILPATTAGGVARELPARVTDAGRGHPVLDVPALDALPSLPPLRVATAAPRVSAGARVLLAGPGGEPVLVAERRGRRGAALLLGAGVWRWRTLPPALANAAPLLPALASRLARFVAADDVRPVRVAPVREAFAAGEPVAFEGQVSGEGGAPAEDALVEVAITGPAARAVAMQALGAGRYALTVDGLPAGAYRFRARATAGGRALGTDEGVFRVGALGAEFADPEPDLGLLRAIAARTGGAVYTVATLDSLRARIAASPAFAPSIVAREVETPLWDRWPLFLLLVGLLAAEWGLRKRWGLV